jgi:spore maturation protein CgeB
MRILFVSNSNPHFLNTNHYRVRALQALGHEVTFFDVKACLLPGRLRVWFPALAALELWRMNVRLTDRCRSGKFDLCLVVGGESVSASSVRQIRSCKIPLMLWTSDAPFKGRFENVLAAAPYYEHVFCAGSEAVSLLDKAVPGKARWVPFACDPDCHRPLVLPAAEAAAYRRDMAFVGSYYPNRARVLGVLAELDLGIWGPGWKTACGGTALESKVIGAHIGFETWRKVYAAAGIVLVVHYQDGVTPCDQASPKLFEAMACGAFVMCDDQKDARMLFKDGEEVVFFSDADDLRRKAVYYLAHEDERRRIAAAGRRAVIAKHTYTHRFEEMLRVMMP